jgi:hypothetical protein
MTSTTITPEVQEFLTTVRAQLADLDLDEQREILDGLEADLTDLVAERGGEALGDPVAYARELRAAAGLEPTARRLRPVWWVLRAWIAVEVAALWLGDWALTAVPGASPEGAVALAAGIAVSIQLGRGRLWPGERWRRVAALRLLLLAVNVGMLAAVPAVLNGFGHHDGRDYTRGYRTGVETGYANGLQEGRVSGNDKAGVYLNGTWVSQIYPYDAKGHPLVGVQLFDQTGRAIDVVTQTECVYDAAGQPVDQGRQYFAWSDGATQKHNVFPVPSKVSGPDTPDPDPQAFTSGPKPSVGQFPFVKVAPISLPGLSTSKGVTPSSAYVRGALPGTPINPIDLGC